MKATINKKGIFCAAHRLYNHQWSNDKNIEIFGKCAYLNYHGHNYEYIVSLTGEVDLITGFVFSLHELKNILFEEIENVLDHRNINIDIEYFSKKNPTVENIVIYIWNKIRKRISNKFSVKVTLYETKNNFVEYDGF
ncbi:6-pyruvoyl trahydropterin synthase family protein [Blattabacterium cuenoti]|uniref:6-pyruvoyl trahydropterin synthase family protein n=1 Tax=Blattabacterium cuenoti TaxID=1653831 RepID=UPI00163B822F|nr:6-carboxytetrahydropterin synthase [Blattabacterium cuenoti]